MPYKILFISKEGNGSDMALRLQKEGCQVRLFIEDPECKENYDGIVPKITSWQGSLSWCDYVVFDDNGMPDAKSAVLRSGKPAFGMGHANRDFKFGKVSFHGSQCCEAIETNRAMTQEIISSLGIGNRIESMEFSSIPDAIKHLKEHRVPHVIKPEVSGSGSEKTYVGEMDDGEDTIGWLETLPARPGAGKIKKIEVEEKISGVEVGCQGWFNGTDWLDSCNINFEHKKIANGELGFNTGEMGTAMYENPNPAQVKFFMETLSKLTPFLRSLDYRGQMDINMIVNEEGIWPLELTPRLGYPASYIEDELEGGKWSELLYAIAQGHDFHHSVKPGWAVGVCLVGEGYPFWKEGKKRMEGMPIIGLNKENLEHLHLYDAKMWDGKIVCTGSYPMAATGTGNTLKEAQAMVYKNIIPQVFFPSMYYRTDIGDKVSDYLKQLNQWGYNVRPE